MAICAYYILGNSDIGYVTENNDYIPGYRLANFRQTTKNYTDLLKENINYSIKDKSLELDERKKIKTRKETKYINKLYFPIISSFIQKICIEEHKKPDNIVIFYTDQKNKKYKKKDTIYLFEIIKLYLRKKYNYKKREITGEKISRNPVDYQMMDKYFREYFKANDQIDKYSTNYLLVTTGIPAMYITFTLEMLNYNNARYYGAVEKGRDCEIKEIKYFKERKNKKYKKMIKNAITSLSYENALEIYRQSPFLRTNPQIEPLLMIGRNLLNFDFKNANRYARRLQKSNLTDKVSDLWMHEADRIKFIFDLIEMYLKNEECLISITYIFGLFDNLRQYIIESRLGVKIEKNKDGKFEAFNSFLEDNESINKIFKEKKLRYYNNPNKIVLRKILSFYKDKHPEIKEFLKIDIKLDDLHERRNKLPLAHGTKGAGSELRKGIEELSEEINKLLKVLEIKESESNLLKETNKEIIENMEIPGEI